MQKRLPQGIQSFSKLIRKNYLYVDKTSEIYKLIEPPSGAYFLSRPRRFGKSLLVSTLNAIFSNKKELFSGLWIENSDYVWEKYPTLCLDMSRVNSSNLSSLNEGIKEQLKRIAAEYNIVLNAKQDAHLCLSNLIFELKQLNSKKEIVVLVDEYDHPLLSQISNLKLAEKIRKFLNGFYGIFKSEDEFIRFIFLTGVSKFSRVSIFSGINHLTDISTDSKYATLLGYTQQELEKYFANQIKNLGKKRDKNNEQIIKDIKKWYNGYRFSKSKNLVYNPHSTISLFYKEEFENYWFETGTPSFLIELIKKQDVSPIDLSNIKTYGGAFECFDVNNLNLIPLLFQTGYLTIKDFSPKENKFQLGYPNQEVFISFTYSLITSFSNINDKVLVENKIDIITQSLHSNNIPVLMRTLKTFFSQIPYTIQISNEKYYQSIFFMLLLLLKQKINVEQQTNVGRIDATIETSTTIYVIEFKLNGSKEDAIKQISEKKYYEKYLDKNKEILLLGVEFKNRNIGEYLIKKVT